MPLSRAAAGAPSPDTDDPMTPMRHPHRPLAIVLALVLPAFLAGCPEARHMATAVSSKSYPYQEYLEDPAALTTIKTIAVFPFDNRAPQPGFDADIFANKLANQLASHGKVRILYPRDILETVERENRATRRHNAELREKLALGLYEPETAAGDRSGEGIFAAGYATDAELRPRHYYNPIKNVDEAVRLARRAKADAVIVGEISDFDPYMRPRLTLTMRLIATGNTEAAAKAIAELTQWGVPAPGSGSAGGVIYIRQQTFDSTVGNVGLEVSKYGRTHHIESHPYDTEIYIRSMTYYYDVVCSQLAKSYMDARKKAVEDAAARAAATARARNEDQAATVRRMTALMERDARIPDYESDACDEAWFDQAFVDKHGLLESNGGDRRIQSWRPEGRSRLPTVAERQGRDTLIPENERGPGISGYPAVVDAAFPDADAMMERNLGDNRDRSWRPDYYNHANPAKSAPLYDPEEFRGP
ncbi:MAG: hypothetical protein LIP77_10415 [Planctomycetes bacterium]|nr:hypothetical protein [Planctomycetota bacterium]